MNHSTQQHQNPAQASSKAMVCSEKPSQAKPAEIKKLEDGTIAVRWEGKKKFNVIQDPAIAAYLVYVIAMGPSYEFQMYRPA